MLFGVQASLQVSHTSPLHCTPFVLQGFVVRVVPKHGSPALRRQAVLMSERSALFFAIGR